ncbi:MAG: autotransporter outer membrane beta-barrel domain-containing protein, partial [Lentisphaerales bacterium]|nr:autotransporter outer membrane beta-barrel domain-containing protein [Lentisphaerales bacterium]
TADTIILKGGTLHLNAGSGFQPGDLFDVNLTSIFVSDDIQDGNGQTSSNTYSLFDSITHSTFLRVKDGHTLVYQGFEGALEDQSISKDVIAALDDHQGILDDPFISEFISTSTSEEIAEFAEETRPQQSLAIETVNLAIDTATLAINGRIQNLGIIFTPTNSSEPEQDDLEGSFWIEGLYSKIDKETTSDTLGYNATVSGTAFGVDQTVNGRTLGFAYSFYDGRSNNRYGHVESEIHQISFYGQQDFKDFYVKGIFGGGVSKSDSSRYIASVNQEAKTDYNTYNFFADLELGKNYEINDMIMTPFIGGRYSRVENDSYKEEGAGTLNLNVNKMTSDSYEGLLGLRVAKQFLLYDESSLVTHLEGSVSHEFGDNSQSVTGRFSTGQINFKSKDTKTADYQYNINGGITWYSKDNLEIQANYFMRFAQDYVEQSVTVNLSVKF